MVKTLNEANKNIEQSKKFYERYIEQAIASNGNLYLCDKLGVSNKTLLMALNRGSAMALNRWANKIEKVLKQ